MAKKKELMEEEPISIDDIKKNSDEVRKRVLEVFEVDYKDTAPSIFDYKVRRKDLGLNIVSNVDMGYATAQVGEHLAKRNPYIRELEYNISLMEQSPNAVVILNGNLFTFVPKSRETGLLSYKTQVAYFHSLFKNLAEQGKILSIVKGTEEHKIDSLHKIDPLKYLSISLGLENKLCNEALVNIDFEDENVGEVNAKLRAVNWQNVATTASYVKRVIHQRAAQKPGADIYFARTALNLFSIERENAVVNGEQVDKPIYLISSGPYKPFAGAKSAGAEYNSVRDAELMPSSFWYKITAVPTDSKSNDYQLNVRPKHYLAHHTMQRSSDEVAASIAKQVASASDVTARFFISKFLEKRSEQEKGNISIIRNAVKRNEAIEVKNANIREYIASKRGVVVIDDDQAIVDGGSDVEIALKKQGQEVERQESSTVLWTQKDNTDRARRVNEILSPEVANKDMEVNDDETGAFMGENPDDAYLDATHLYSDGGLHQKDVDATKVDYDQVAGNSGKVAGEKESAEGEVETIVQDCSIEDRLQEIDFDERDVREM